MGLFDGLISWILEPLTGKSIRFKDTPKLTSKGMSLDCHFKGDADEVELLNIILSAFLSEGGVRIGNCRPLSNDKNKNSNDYFETLKSSNAYVWVKSFVKKHRDEQVREQKVNELKELLGLKGIALTEGALKEHIHHAEIETQEEEFSQKFLDCKKTFLSYLERFVQDFFNKVLSENYEGPVGYNECKNGKWFRTGPSEDETGIKYSFQRASKLARLVACFKGTLKRDGIELKDDAGQEIDNEALCQRILDVKNGIRLSKLEKSLIDADVYSMSEIDSMGGYEFESFLKSLFEKMGYSVKQTKLSGDQGADLIVNKAGETMVVQAKRYNGVVGNSAIQEIVASINHYSADRGMVVTNNKYTTSALELAKSNKITLIDRTQLEQWIKEFF